MRVSSINNVYVKSQNNVRRAQTIKTEKAVDIKVQPEENINFKGKTGAIAGGVAALAIMLSGGAAAPVVAMLSGSLLGAVGTATTVATGAILGSATEEIVKKDD